MSDSSAYSDAPPAQAGGASPRVAGEPQGAGMIRRILASSRFLMILTVAATFATSATLLVFDALLTVAVIIDTIRGAHLDTEYGRELAVTMLSIIDLALLGIVFFVISIGVYQLFIDDRLVLPGWLRVHDLDDLKRKLVSVVVTLLGVFFLEIVVTGSGGTEILASGLGMGAVIAALSLFAGTIRVAGS